MNSLILRNDISVPFIGAAVEQTRERRDIPPPALRHPRIGVPLIKHRGTVHADSVTPATAERKRRQTPLVADVAVEARPTPAVAPGAPGERTRKSSSVEASNSYDIE